jgi:hypothetical protein
VCGETIILTVTARHPTRRLSEADLAGETELDHTVARPTAES